MPEKYIRLVQDMYRGCKTVTSAQCGRGEQQLWGGGRTTPRLGLKPIPVPILLMDVLTEDVRKDVPGSMMFADDIVLYVMTRQT